MFVLNQRTSILNTSLITLRQFSINTNDKIRINKSNVYYKDRINLEN
jgi:hypothetical protein